MGNERTDQNAKLQVDHGFGCPYFLLVHQIDVYYISNVGRKTVASQVVVFPNT